MYCPDSRVPKSCANLGGNSAEFIANEHEHFRADQVLATPTTSTPAGGVGNPSPSPAVPTLPFEGHGFFKKSF